MNVNLWSFTHTTVKQNNQSHEALTSRWHDADMFSKWDVNAFLVSLFDKPATGSIYNGTDQNLVVCIQAIELCDLKMDVIKWQLNFESCNFGLKSNHTDDFRPDCTPLISITIIYGVYFVSIFSTIAIRITERFTDRAIWLVEIFWFSELDSFAQL